MERPLSASGRARSGAGGGLERGPAVGRTYGRAAGDELQPLQMQHDVDLSISQLTVDSPVAESPVVHEGTSIEGAAAWAQVDAVQQEEHGGGSMVDEDEQGVDEEADVVDEEELGCDEPDSSCIPQETQQAGEAAAVRAAVARQAAAGPTTAGHAAVQQGQQMKANATDVAPTPRGHQQEQSAPPPPPPPLPPQQQQQLEGQQQRQQHVRSNAAVQAAETLPPPPQQQPVVKPLAQSVNLIQKFRGTKQQAQAPVDISGQAHASLSAGATSADGPRPSTPGAEDGRATASVSSTPRGATGGVVAQQRRRSPEPEAQEAGPTAPTAAAGLGDRRRDAGQGGHNVADQLSAGLESKQAGCNSGQGGGEAPVVAHSSKPKPVKASRKPGAEPAHTLPPAQRGVALTASGDSGAEGRDGREGPVLQEAAGEAGAGRGQEPAHEGHRERRRRGEEAEQVAEMEPTSIMPRDPGAAVQGGRVATAAGEGVGEGEGDGWAGTSGRGGAAAGSPAQRRQRGPAAAAAAALSVGPSTPSTPGASSSRAFDEDDPVQVLEESYLVLAEIELLICDALQLPPGSSLGTVDPQALCQVPAELIDALAETVQVMMDAKAQLQAEADEWERTIATSADSSVRSARTGRPSRGHYGTASPSSSRTVSERGSTSGSVRRRQPSQMQSHASPSPRSSNGYTSKRDYLREPPPPGWLEAQVARQAEARRRRVQQVQKDLQLIHRIKAKGQAALQHHQQALQESEASRAQLRAQASKTRAYSKWLQYQEAIAGGR